MDGGDGLALVTEVIAQRPQDTGLATVRGGALGLAIAGGLVLTRGDVTGHETEHRETDASLAAGRATESRVESLGVNAGAIVMKYISAARSKFIYSYCVLIQPI